MMVAHTMPPPTITSTATVAMMRLTSSHCGILRKIILIRLKRRRGTAICSGYSTPLAAHTREMCDRNRDCIVLVVVFDILSYLHEDVEHSGNRLLVGAAISRRCALHFTRRIFENFDTGSLRGIDKYTAHLGDAHC